jgi:hypothetical protein
MQTQPQPQPQPSPLYPMDLSDILDTVFRIYRNNFLTFIGIVALLQIPMILIQITITLVFNQGVVTDITQLIRELPAFDIQEESLSDLPIGNILLFGFSTLLFALIQGVVVQQLINGALTHASSRCYLDRPVSMLSAYQFGVGRMAKLVLAGLLVSVLIGLVVMLVYGVMAAVVFVTVSVGSSQSGSGGALAVFFMIVVLLVGIVLAIAMVLLLWIGFLFVTQAVVLEGRGPIEALGRSLRLVRYSFWRVLGIAVLMYLMVWILTLIPSAVLGGVVGVVFSDPLRDLVLRQTFSTLVGYATQILVLPPLFIAYTLLYYDMRIRYEGYDLSERIGLYSVDG